MPRSPVLLPLFLHPKIFEPFSVDMTQGLWQARNRRMVVSVLEAALVDPRQYAGIDLLDLVVAFKARLEVPFDPANPAAPLPTKIIEAQYLHQLAETLPERNGAVLADAARTVMFYGVRDGQRNSTDFAAD